MSLSPSHTRRTAAALTLAALLPLTLSTPAAARVRPRLRPAHPASAATSAISAISPSWRSLAELWHLLISGAADAGDAADTTADPGGKLPADDNGGMIDPNGKPKPAPPHP